MNPHTQASLLKAFYKELEDPLFSAKLYPGWIAGAFKFFFASPKLH